MDHDLLTQKLLLHWEGLEPTSPMDHIKFPKPSTKHDLLDKQELFSLFIKIEFYIFWKMDLMILE